MSEGCVPGDNSRASPKFSYAGRLWAYLRTLINNQPTVEVVGRGQGDIRGYLTVMRATRQADIAQTSTSAARDGSFVRLHLLIVTGSRPAHWHDIEENMINEYYWCVS